MDQSSTSNGQGNVSRRRFLRLAGMGVAGATLLSACTPAAPTAAPAAPKAAAPSAKPAEGGAWQEEWERTVAAAKQEGAVNVVGPSGDVIRQHMLDGFRAAYPEIALDWQGGRNTDMATKMEAERRADIYNVDVFLGGTSTALRLVRPIGALADIKPWLIHGDVTDPTKWFGGKLEYSDAAQQNLVFISVPSTVVMYNPQVVKREEIDDMEDLLDPKWNQKIAINDPVPTGAGNVSFRFFWEALGPERAEEYIRALRAQAAAVSRDERAQVEWVARNRYPIVIGASGLTQQQLEEIRDRVDVLTQFNEYGGLVTASSGSAMAIDRPPHPNAAKVFLNWLLSKDGQTQWSTALVQPSRRLDVPTDHLPAHLIPKESDKYWLSYTEENVKVPERLTALFQELFTQ